MTEDGRRHRQRLRKAYMDTTCNCAPSPTARPRAGSRALGGLRKLRGRPGEARRYQREKGIVVTERASTSENARLASSHPGAEAQNLSTRLPRAGVPPRNASAMPEVLANRDPVAQGRRMRAEAKLQEAPTRLGPNIRNTAAGLEIEALRSRLNGETNRIVAGSRNARAEPRARAAAAGGARRTAQARGGDADARNHSYVLQRDVETRRRPTKRRSRATWLKRCRAARARPT